MTSKFTQLRDELLSELMLLNVANPDQQLRVAHKFAAEVPDQEFILYMAPTNQPDYNIASDDFSGFYMVIMPHPDDTPMMAGMYERNEKVERCVSATIKFDRISDELAEGFHNFLAYGIVGVGFAVDD